MRHRRIETCMRKSIVVISCSILLLNHICGSCCLGWGLAVQLEPQGYAIPALQAPLERPHKQRKACWNGIQEFTCNPSPAPRNGGQDATEMGGGNAYDSHNA